MEEIPAPVIVYGGATEKSRIVTFKIPPDELKLVDRAAVKLGMSRSELIRAALHYYIRELLGDILDHAR